MQLQIDLTNEYSLKGLWLWISGRLSVQDIWLNPERTSYWHNFHPNFLLKLRVADLVFRLLLPSDSNLSKTTYVREKKATQQTNDYILTYQKAYKLNNTRNYHQDPKQGNDNRSNALSCPQWSLAGRCYKAVMG